MRHSVALLAGLVLTGCASSATAIPGNLALGSSGPVAAAALREAPDAPPRILHMWFSSNDVRLGTVWSGQVVASTNVASVEIRTNLFSIDAPHVAPGRFAFRLRVFDVPPIFIRGYRLRVIARNTAGAATEEDLPFRIR